MIVTTIDKDHPAYRQIVNHEQLQRAHGGRGSVLVSVPSSDLSYFTDDFCRWFAENHLAWGRPCFFADNGVYTRVDLRFEDERDALLFTMRWL